MGMMGIMRIMDIIATLHHHGYHMGIESCCRTPSDMERRILALLLARGAGYSLGYDAFFKRLFDTLITQVLLNDSTWCSPR